LGAIRCKRHASLSEARESLNISAINRLSCSRDSTMKVKSCAIKFVAFSLLLLVACCDCKLPLICAQNSLRNLDIRPSQGSLLFKDTMKSFCECNLITQDYAISAAHCFHHKAIDMAKVVVHFKQLDSDNGALVKPIIDLAFHADVSIIRFSPGVKFSRAMQPICIERSVDWIRDTLAMKWNYIQMDCDYIVT